MTRHPLHSASWTLIIGLALTGFVSWLFGWVCLQGGAQ
jgi:hypothetical protein